VNLIIKLTSLFVLFCFATGAMAADDLATLQWQALMPAKMIFKMLSRQPGKCVKIKRA
jgi:hypothetical protein